MNYWLFKTEPSVFGLDDLRAAPHATTVWDGVRNYQARNFIRDEIARGDRGILYHSSCAVPAAVALLEVVRAGYPDPSADRPVWYAVDVRLLLAFPRPVSLAAMREDPDLADSRLLRRGNRLSIFPLTRKEIRAILVQAGLDADDHLAPSA
jgi:predicted RNA-binding protein with PUA-like domain